MSEFHEEEQIRAMYVEDPEVHNQTRLECIKAVDSRCDGVQIVDIAKIKD